VKKKRMAVSSSNKTICSTVIEKINCFKSLMLVLNKLHCSKPGICTVLWLVLSSVTVILSTVSCIRYGLTGVISASKMARTRLRTKNSLYGLTNRNTLPNTEKSNIFFLFEVTFIIQGKGNLSEDDLNGFARLVDKWQDESIFRSCTHLPVILIETG